MLEKIKQLGELINKAEKIALFSHIRMDPDTFGSSSALYYILKKIGKKVVLLNDEEAPDEFCFMGANDIISHNYNLKEFNPDLIISLDAASIGQLAESYENNKEIIENTQFVVIDHHITNNGFGKINIIDTHSSSTCELLFEILEINDLVKYIDSKISTLLITGILTDTNVFYNTNVTSKTHFIAGKLLDLGADSRTSIFEFFKKKSIKRSKLLGKALSNIEIINPLLISPKGREIATKLGNKNIIYTIITQEDFDILGATDRDTNGIIEHLINIENTEIAFIIYPLPNGTNKASFRSHSYDVSQIAQKLGGGGHKQAAGCSSNDNIEIFLEKIKINLKNND